jgi:uncharacterized protein YbjQ (UPF0145 family)
LKPKKKLLRLLLNGLRSLAEGHKEVAEKELAEAEAVAVRRLIARVYASSYQVRACLR